jgi:general secretion pathway protein B
MSLILEALRKSEAERRRGQAPDLLSEATPSAPVSPTTMARSWPWLFALAAVIIAALLLLLWRPRDTATTAGDSAVAESQTAPAAKDNHMTSMGVARAAVIPAHPVIAPRRAAAPGLTSTARTAPTNPEIVPAAVPSKTEAAPPAREVAAVTKPIAPPAIEPPVITPAAAPEPVPVSTATSFTSPDRPLRLTDLAGDERKQLPALKISMHMWAPDAAHRFAIIDGNRVSEGDRVGEATIEAILEDSVMLAWRGRHIRLPIR